MNTKLNHIITRCWSAKGGEDEVEGGGGGTLLDVEPGDEQTNKVQAKKREHSKNKGGSTLLDVEPGDKQKKSNVQANKQTNKHSKS